MAPPANSQRKDWYQISLDTLRSWGWGVLTIGAIVGGAYLWHHQVMLTAARHAVEEGQTLADKLAEMSSELGSYRGELEASQEGLREARARLEEHDYARALEKARRCDALLQSIYDALRPRGGEGEAQFISVQGSVELRAGDSGDWDEARSRQVLRTGDYVKTSGNGSAEIMFRDGTLYTVRPNTLFLVTRNRAAGAAEQAIRMEYGWVNLNTSQRGSQVGTPGAEAKVEEQSEAAVSYDRSSGAARFAAYRGGMEVSSRGVTRSVGAMQEVVQANSQISLPKSLPVAPEPLQPPDNVEINFDRGRELVLAWQPVSGAAHYALQISRNRLFVDNIVDVGNRTRPSATLAMRGEGTFLWRVAAFSHEGLEGPWSPAREIRIAALHGPAEDGEIAPPPLELDDVRTYGSIVIVAGKTRPGAVVLVNGEAVAVGADGGFTKTVQIVKEGWSFVEVKARDQRGRETARRRRVFVEMS